MSFKTILVHVDATTKSDSRLVASVSLAERFGACLIGLAAETIQPSMVDPMTGIGAVDWTQLQLDQIRKGFTEAEIKFRAQANGVKSEWRTAIDTPAQALAASASAADLIVVGSEQPEINWNPAHFVRMGDLLMSAGRPVLVLTEAAAATDFGRILVAWKDRPETRRALTDSLPLIKVAKHVTVVHIKEAAGEVRSIPDVNTFLAHHEVKCDVRIVEQTGETPEVQIYDEASRVGANLIVAGAYGHSRLREWAFGGVTQALLTSCPVACLFSH